jgi:ribosomal protein S18 acetylase RimI-like enzyme
MHIQIVQTRKDLAEFIDLPYRLYRKDPVWVPPLRSEQWGQFDPSRNPMLDHCEHALFLLRDGPRVIGRVSAFVDRLALETWKEPIGLFGSYECVRDPRASALLLSAARDWLRGRGMKAMRGPWSFASQEWGLVIEGFTPPPVIMAPYNPPYYNDHLTAFGLAKIKDLLVYYVDSREGYQIPVRYLQLTDLVEQRYHVRVRMADMRHFEREVATFVELANRSIADNWGFYPITAEEGRAIARDLRQIIDPRGILFAEDADGRAIGFAMAIPDVNTILHGLGGSLFPLGWVRLLWGLPRVRQYRMWALGVIPEYHGRAVDALMYRKLYETLAPRKIRLEINYVLEDNAPMNNALINLGVKPLRRYRVYQGTI